MLVLDISCGCKVGFFSDIMDKLTEEEFIEMKNDIREHFQDELKKMSNYTNYLKHLKSIKENETSVLIDLCARTVGKEIEYQNQIFDTLEKINKNFPEEHLSSIFTMMFSIVKEKDNFEFIRNVKNALDGLEFLNDI